MRSVAGVLLRRVLPVGRAGHGAWLAAGVAAAGRRWRASDGGDGGRRRGLQSPPQLRLTHSNSAYEIYFQRLMFVWLHSQVFVAVFAPLWLLVCSAWLKHDSTSIRYVQVVTWISVSIATFFLGVALRKRTEAGAECSFLSKSSHTKKMGK